MNPSPKAFFQSADYFFCFLSAVFLILAFPQTDFWILAWIALVPLFYVLDGKNMRAAFGRAYLTGFIFFAATFYWFIHVTAIGAFLIVSYLAIYFGLFGLGYSFFQKRKLLEKLFVLPSLWVALEFIRAHFLTGFGWASVGHSQYENLPVIQIADLTGMWGVSFVVVMVNCLFKELIGIKNIRTIKQPLREAIFITATVMAIVLGYGFFCLNRTYDLPKVTVSVVQGNIPQELKWNEAMWPDILAKQVVLSEQAARENPQLIIWPETSFPGLIGEDDALLGEMQGFVKRLNIPLVFGSVVKVTVPMRGALTGCCG